MDLTAALEAPCRPAELFAWVEDLGRYPAWLEIVPRVSAAQPRAGDAGPAWVVDLRGRLGAFARTKRLRMVRILHEPPHAVRFERAENDGRRHSPWVLEARLQPCPPGCRLVMRLHYGGRLWISPLDRLLAEEIERSRARLLACVTGGV